MSEREPVMQTVRRTDNAIVTWYVDTTGVIPHLLPAIEALDLKLDYREIRRLHTHYYQPVFCQGWNAERLQSYLQP